MFKRSFLVSACALVGILVCSPELGAQSRQGAARSAGGTAVDVVHLDGLDIEFDATGNWTRMYSTYRQPVGFPDRQGLRKAYTIAEEKGKAQVVRHLEQEITSERLVEEVDNATQQATRTQNGQSASINKTTRPHMVESVRELTRSFSRGTLRGVTVLEQGYDEKAEEVRVKIGISRTSIRLSDHLLQAMKAAEMTSRGAVKPLAQPGASAKRPIP
jgi:hypothetical protein